MSQWLKSTCCSCRKHWFSSQNPLGSLQLSAAPVLGDPVLSYDPAGTKGVQHTNTCRQNAHTHKVKINLKKQTNMVLPICQGRTETSYKIRGIFIFKTLVYTVKVTWELTLEDGSHWPWQHSFTLVWILRGYWVGYTSAPLKWYSCQTCKVCGYDYTVSFLLFLFQFFYYIFIVGTHELQLRWKSEDSLQGQFVHCVGFRDWARLLRLSGRYVYWLNHLTDPMFSLFFFVFHCL